MKETLPSYEAMMPVVLKLLANGATRGLREVFERVCQHYAFTPEQLAETLPSNRQTTLRSRETYLVKAGLIEQPKRGLCLITERGKAALASGQIIDNRYLTQFNQFVDFAQISSESAGNEQQAVASPADIPAPELASTPQEQIAQALSAINHSLADDLLTEILDLSPRFFEKLVVDLMVAMGYDGSQQDAARTTYLSRDGAINGIIKEDRLGLDSIYLQAKRYTDKTVGRPEIQSFAGTLDLHKTRKGVLSSSPALAAKRGYMWT